MTRLTLTMPRLGETMEEGVILTWLVQPGQRFRRGEPLLEVESDKTVVEYPALGDGRLEALLADEGSRLPVGAAIAEADVEDAADWAELSAGSAKPAADPAPEPSQGPAILRMPQLGETMLDGVIFSWLVAEGESYRRGQSLLEIETDKTMAEVPALSDGKLLRILAQPGERLEVGTPIAEVEGEVDEPLAAPAEKPQPVAAPAAEITAQTAEMSGRLRATPVARRLARQGGLDLAHLSGTGRRGRIERGDVEQALQSGAGARTRAPLPASSDDPLWQAPKGGDLSFTRIGEGGETFLLLHGFAGDRSAWAQLAALLKRAGQTVITPDLPGHGATEMAADTVEALVDAVVAFAQNWPEPLVLVGHSLGGAVAVQAAERLGGKVSRLVLLTPAGCGPRIAPEFVRGMASAPSASDLPKLLSYLGPKGAGLSAAALKQMEVELGKQRLRSLAAALVQEDGRQTLDSLTPLARLSKRLKVTAVFGKDDQVVSVQDALNMPPEVAVHFFAAGHMPQWDQPAELAALLTKTGGSGAG